MDCLPIAARRMLAGGWCGNRVCRSLGEERCSCCHQLSHFICPHVQALLTAGAVGDLLAEQLDALLAALLSGPESVEFGTTVEPEPQPDAPPAPAIINEPLG